MKFLLRLTVLFYVALVIVTSGIILYFTLQLVAFDSFVQVASLFYFDKNLQIFLSFWAVLLLVQNLVFYRLIFTSIRRSNVIAFDNPSGRVTVSLIALEDLVRRKVSQKDEVKDVRPSITANRKGLKVKVRLVLRSEVNIPELTSEIQNQVKRRLQEIIGLEEPVDVAIYVGKIIPEKVSSKSKKSVEDEKTDPNIPFQGYRA